MNFPAHSVKTDFVPVHTGRLLKDGTKPYEELVFFNKAISTCPTCGALMIEKGIRIIWGENAADFDHVVNGIAREIYVSLTVGVVLYVRNLICGNPACGRNHRELPEGCIPYSKAVTAVLLMAFRAFLKKEAPGRSFSFLKDDYDHLYVTGQMPRFRTMCKVVWGVIGLTAEALFGYLGGIKTTSDGVTACRIGLISELIRTYSNLRYNKPR
ncbi:MAG: hypothetical protein RR579_08865 [Eubacterium sp.]